MVREYTYLIWKKDASTYSCQSGLTGCNVYSSSSAHAVIQYAIDNLTAGRTWKERIILKGDFTLTAPVTLASYMILELDGRVFRGNAQADYMLQASSKSNFEIMGGLWDGNRADATNQAAYSAADNFEFVSCTDVYIHDLRIGNSPYQNIVFISGARVVVERVESYGSYWDSIIFAYSSECRASHCYIHDIDQGGIYAYCENDATAQTVNNIVYEENRVENTLTTGLSISLRGAEDTGMYGRIEHNTLIDCGHDGQHPAINCGFDPDKLARYCLIHGNTIYETGTYDGSGGCGGGINLEGEYCTVSDNIVYNCTDPGIYILFGGKNIICNNYIRNTRGSTASGLAIIDTDYNDIFGNTIRDSAINGIYLDTDGGDGSDYNYIHHNTVEGVDSWWVRIASGSDNNRIEYNNFLGAKTVSSSGTNNIFRFNSGLVTEKSGTATFTAATTLNVSHGCSNTPTKVLVQGSDTNSSALWVTSIGTSTFTVNRGNSTGTPTIYWRAEV